MVRTMIPADGMQTMAGLKGEATAIRAEGTTPNPLERLIRIVRQNDDLLGRLEVQGRRLARAKAYAADPGCNPSLAAVLLDHERAGYGTILGRLRANRSEANAILVSCGHDELPLKS